MATFWISFATDEGCRGVAIVDADDGVAAIREAARLGINPGGQTLVIEMPADDPEAAAEVLELGRNRLISAQELADRQYLKISGLDPAVAAPLEAFLNADPSVTLVCEGHNPPAPP